MEKVYAKPFKLLQTCYRFHLGTEAGVARSALNDDADECTPISEQQAAPVIVRPRTRTGCHSSETRSGEIPSKAPTHAQQHTALLQKPGSNPDPLLRTSGTVRVN